MSATHAKPVLVWCTNDLRLTDNEALSAAVATGNALLFCYVLDDSLPLSSAGAASRWWLHQSLAELAGRIEELGGKLLLRRGPLVPTLAELVTEAGASRVFASRSFVPDLAAAQQKLEIELRQSGVRLTLCPGSLLFDPAAIRTASGSPFRVFTPFSKACLDAGVTSDPLAAPGPVHFFPTSIESERLDSWRLRPVSPNWARGFESSWHPGEIGAHARLDRFLDGPLSSYPTLRDRPDLDGTSKLSPHLHFGELSPRQVWQAVSLKAHAEPACEVAAQSYLRQILWREFSQHLLWHWPDLSEAPLRPEFARFPWRDDAAGLAAWQKGQTGYPIVDAGTRELWTTGWMHNRVRMIAASFLVKDLLVPWQRGAEWFLDTLVDADPGNNAASWQWVAGCGTDAAPYFRIFNPVTQSRKFDPEGAYIKRWVPELRDLAAEHVHEPAAAPSDALSRAGIRLGSNYPHPLVNHATARKGALDAYQAIKRG